MGARHPRHARFAARGSGWLRSRCFATLLTSAARVVVLKASGRRNVKKDRHACGASNKGTGRLYEKTSGDTQSYCDFQSTERVCLTMCTVSPYTLACNSAASSTGDCYASSKTTIAGKSARTSCGGYCKHPRGVACRRRHQRRHSRSARLARSPVEGRPAGTWSISVSGNWRITFEIEQGEMCNLNLEDYH